MKKNLIICSLCSFASLFSVESKAQLKVLYYFNFNKANNPATGDGGVQMSPYVADYSRTGTPAWFIWAKVAGVKLDTAIMDNYTSEPLCADSNFQPGLGGGWINPNYELRARNPSDSMQLLLYAPTTHYSNILIKYITEVSSLTSGQACQLYTYSTDSGVTWQNTGLNMTFDSLGIKEWHLDSISLAGATGVNNNPKFVFRIRFRTQITGTSGNNRFGNITVQGDSDVGQGVANVQNGMKFNVFPNPANTIININALLPLKETVSNMYLYNVAGELVKSEELKGTSGSINIHELPNGIYLYKLTDQEGNLIQTDKLVIMH